MKEDIFLKIGANQNVWGKKNNIHTLFIDVYKNFSLCKSILELDITLNAEFMLLVFFLFYNIQDGDSQLKYYDLAGDIFFTVLILFTNIYTHVIVRSTYSYNFHRLIERKRDSTVSSSS
jgi:hypothetical protein